MKSRMSIQFCPGELDGLGVQLVELEFRDEPEDGRFIEFIQHIDFFDSQLCMNQGDIDYLNALMFDVVRASTESHEAAMLMRDRLNAIKFGPIRCVDLKSR